MSSYHFRLLSNIYDSTRKIFQWREKIWHHFFSATALFSGQSSTIMIDEVQAKVNPLRTTKQKNLANARTFLGQTI